MRRILLCLWISLFALVAVPAGAQSFPKLTGLVVDDAGVLPAETRADLTRKLQALQRDTKRQFVVATIGDVQGYPLEDYGYRLGRAWGIGLKDANNGAILFIAPNNPAGQRGPRLEVGYGLEPILTDAISSAIIQQQMMPKLKAGDIAGAMTAGADAVVAQLRLSPEEAQARVDAAAAAFDRGRRQRPQSSGSGLPTGAIFFIAIGVIIFCMLVFSGRRRRAGPWGQRHRSSTAGHVAQVVLWSIADELARSAARGGGSGWSGGSSRGSSGGGWTGGGFTGGGGGSFGGGGASGNW